MKNSNLIIKNIPKVGNVLFYTNPCLQKSTISVLWKVGSIREIHPYWGISHFIEHMMFKGTKNYPSAKLLSDQVYRVGGYMNASTYYDKTNYYIKVPHSSLELGIKILADMMYYSLLREKDIAEESKVVMQENKKYDSEPLSYTMDKFHSIMTKNSNLMHNIGGTNQNLSHIRLSHIIDYLKNHYKRKNRLICISTTRGNLKKAKQLVKKYFSRRIEYGDGKKYKSHKREFLKMEEKNEKRNMNVSFSHFPYTGVCTKFKKLEQAHIFVGFPAYSMKDDRNNIVYLISTILAGNMSSRLFIKLREENGLVYTVSSHTNEYENYGYFSIYAGTNNEEKKINRVLELIEEEILDIKKNGFREEEIENMKKSIIEQLKMVDPDNMLMYYSNDYIMMKRVETNEEKIKKYRAIKKEDIDRVIGDIFREDRICEYVMTDKRVKFLESWKKSKK
jgi:predicted Zn-dependent peptidase